MQKHGFRNFLENCGLTNKGIASRMSKSNSAEKILGYSLDVAVDTDEMMCQSIIKIQPHEDPKHNLIQNALRKYYIFKNGKNFPQLKSYKG